MAHKKKKNVYRVLSIVHFSLDDITIDSNEEIRIQIWIQTNEMDPDPLRKTH